MNNQKNHLSRFDLQNILVHKVKRENDWLKTVNSQALFALLINAESAFTKFFREKNRIHKFQIKKNQVQSFQLPQHYNVDFENNVIMFPKIGEVKAVLHRYFEGTLKTATISESSTRRLFISILVMIGQKFQINKKYLNQVL
jgi:putative transposase